MNSNLGIITERIETDIAALAARTEPGRPYTRRAFTPRFLEGRAYIEERMREAGLETRIDAGGNLIGRRAGTGKGKGTILLGSHSDTVPDGGRFDGIAGVVAAIEVARALADREIALSHDLEIVDFLAEEVTIFGVSCVGSRAMAGLLDPDWLERKSEETTLREGIGAMGGDAARLASAARSDIAAFLELHIEQGPVLDAMGEDIGVVNAIAGITRVEIIVEGRADHAGTTPMTRRADALAAGAELVLAIEAEARRVGAGMRHFAATVGEISIEPGAANVVPARARLLVDARAEEPTDMESFLAWLDRTARGIAQAREVRVETRIVSNNQPTAGDAGLLARLDAACTRLGVKHRRMASGAGHDTAWISRIAPAAMIFVPCRGGRSHTPEESSESGEIALGAAVLLETVIDIDATWENG